MHQFAVADCDDELAAEVDATQECHLESAPYVPADRVGETSKDSLAGEGYEVDTVECEDELAGEVEATVSCTASPAEGEGEGKIMATVTSVDGLMVNFDFEAVS